MNKLLISVFLLLSIHCLRNTASIKETNLSLSWQFEGDYIDVEIISKNAVFVPILLSSKMMNTDFWACSK